VIVDREVTQLKFESELELWRENEDTYRRRGGCCSPRTSSRSRSGSSADSRSGADRFRP